MLFVKDSADTGLHNNLHQKFFEKAAITAMVALPLFIAFKTPYYNFTATL